MTTLFDAIEQGDTQSLRKLMRTGIHLEQVDEESGVAPLALASEYGYIHIVKILLRAGVDPDWGGATTPLEAAALEGHVPVVQALIEASADVNRPVSDGFTPLITAASTGNLEMVRMLLTAGANPSVTDDEGETALTVAEKKGHGEVANAIRTFAEQTNGHRPAKSLFDAIKIRDLLSLREQLKRDDLEEAIAATDRDGLTPVGQAAQVGHVALVQSLLEAGADIENGGVRTPLYYAAANRHDPVVAVLIAEGADANAPSGEDGVTPLMAAAASGHLEIVRMLLDAGADPKTLDAQRKDALWHAASTGQEQIFTFLLPRIKVVDRKSATSELASHVETRRKMALAAAQLIDYIHAGDIAAAKRHLANGVVDPDGFDEEGRTAMMLAARLGRRDLLRMLIASGASFELRDDVEGFTALIHSIHGSGAKKHLTVGLLVAAGADVDNPSADGLTPLMHAADLYLDGDAEDIQTFRGIAEPLVHAGVDLEATDADGRTAWKRIRRRALGEDVDAAERRKLSRLRRVMQTFGARMSGAEGIDLITAVAQGEMGRVRDLLNDFQESDDFEGLPVLTVAAENDHWDVVSHLMGLGLDINTPNQQGDTVLMLAATKGILPIVEQLVQAGADPKIKNAEGKLAAALARAAGHHEVADFLTK